jgi:hypothetical protein
MRHSKKSILIIEYLREYEFMFETALSHESGGSGIFFDERIQRLKIS